MHDRDPLEHVTAAWVEFFDDEATLGSLELEIDRVLVALSHDGVSLPDYYVVLAPESLAPTWKHWWLGVLPQASPTRVIPWSDSEASLARLLRRLPTGRPWPAPEPWLRGLTHAVPDRVGLERGVAGGGLSRHGQPNEALIALREMPGTTRSSFATS